MPTMLPLLQGFAATDTLAWEGDRAITAAHFCHAARKLSSRLPRHRFAFNLCERQIPFLIASAAALMSGQTLILPPTRLRTVVDGLRHDYERSYCLFDATTTLPDSAATHGVMVADAFDNGVEWPPPMLSDDHDAAVLFTSGSTKVPQPQPKKWAELVNGTATLVKSLGNPSRGSAIIGTVAPQHMFGFETTVMLPLQSGTPVRDARPAYPADLAQALAAAVADGVEKIWLMTTPLQLRAFHRELRDVAGLHRIIASTMPLDVELATAVERDWQVPVHEIYGCTEAGILATRRPAQRRSFTPAAGLTFTLDPDGAARVSGGHLSSPLTLTDRIRWSDAEGASAGTEFELLGRDSDIVKIAGKRGSLAGLTAELLRIDGVRDGVIFLPEADAPRVAAIVVAPELSAAGLRAQLMSRIDAAFMPRPIVFVDALPREANAKLPLAALREIVTRNRDVKPTTLTRQWNVDAEHPALPGHFPGQPILPGVMLLQMVQTMLADAGYRVRECREVKFKSQVAPAVPIEVRVEIDIAHTARFVASTASGTAMAGTFICQDASART